MNQYILARAILECNDSKCHLCAGCLHLIRKVLGISESGWVGPDVENLPADGEPRRRKRKRNRIKGADDGTSSMEDNRA